MTHSNAQRGSWCFAQGTDDGMCRISLNGAGTKFNVQFSIGEVPRIIRDLLEVLESDRIRLQNLTIQQADELEDKTK